MANRARTAAAMAMAMLLIPGATSAASDAGETIVLTVENQCRMDRYVLEAAQRQAAAVYDEIGIGLVWLPAGVAPSPEPTGSMRLRVVLPDKATEKVMASGLSNRGPLGVAPSGTSDVYVFCRRVTRMPAVVSLATVLGRALAHEIGHQVLPGMGHADTGIMRALLDLNKGKAPGFTGAQTQSIRALLAQGTQP